MANDVHRVQLNVSMEKELHTWLSKLVMSHGYVRANGPAFSKFFRDWRARVRASEANETAQSDQEAVLKVFESIPINSGGNGGNSKANEEYSVSDIMCLARKVAAIKGDEVAQEFELRLLRKYHPFALEIIEASERIVTAPTE